MARVRVTPFRSDPSISPRADSGCWIPYKLKLAGLGFERARKFANFVAPAAGPFI